MHIVVFCLNQFYSSDIMVCIHNGRESNDCGNILKLNIFKLNIGVREKCTSSLDLITMTKKER